MKLQAVCMVVIVSALLAPRGLRADTVLLAAPNLSSNGGTGFFYSPVGSQGTVLNEAANQFSLSAAALVTTIDVTTVELVNAHPFTLSLRSSLSGPDIASFSFTGVGLLTADPHTMTLDQNLAAGTYYLILSSTDLEEGGWALSDNTLLQNTGTIFDGIWFTGDGGATWNSFTSADLNCQSEAPGASACGPLVFTIHGASAIPEPASVFLMVTGLASLALRSRRKRLRVLTPASVVLASTDSGSSMGYATRPAQRSKAFTRSSEPS